MSTHHPLNGRDREVSSNGTHLPSFRDLVSFPPNGALTRPVERSTTSRDQREDRIVETPLGRHPEATFEIVGIKRAASQASYRDAADLHARKDHEYDHRDRTHGEGVRPDQDRCNLSQGNNDHSSPRFLQPKPDHRQHLLHAGSAKHGNGHAHPDRQEYKPKTNASLAREPPPHEVTPSSHQMVRSSKEYHAREDAHSIRPPFGAVQTSRPPPRAQVSYESVPYVQSHSDSGRKATHHSHDARYDTGQSRQDECRDLRVSQSGQPPVQNRPPLGRHPDVHGSPSVHHDAYIYSQERRSEDMSSQRARASQASPFIASHHQAAPTRQPGHHRTDERAFGHTDARLPTETHRPSSFSNAARPVSSPRIEQRIMAPPQAGHRPKESQHGSGRADIGRYPRHSAGEPPLSTHRSRPDDDYRTQSTQAGARGPPQASRPHNPDGNGAFRENGRPKHRIAAVEDSPVHRNHQMGRAISPAYGDHLRFPSALNGRHPSATVNKVDVDRDRDLRVLRSSDKNQRAPMHPPQSQRAEAATLPSTHTRDHGRHELAYHFELQQRQMEEERLRSLRQREQVKLPQAPRSKEHNVRASYPQERVQARYDQTRMPSPMIRDMRSLDRGKERQVGQVSVVAEPKAYAWNDRDRCSDYPPLPPLSSDRGSGHRHFEQQPPSKGPYRTETSASGPFRGNGALTLVTVSETPRPIEASGVSVDSRPQTRFQDARSVPRHHLRPHDHPSSAAGHPNTPSRATNSHAPVIASQHTHTRPLRDDQPPTPLPAPPRPLKRQRAGSDTTLVLKSTRLALVEPEAERRTPTSLAMQRHPCSDK